RPGKGEGPEGVSIRVVDLVPRFRPGRVAIVSSFILGSVRATGRAGVVLGLSGGVDSALVAKLCADALGPDRVSALALPDGDGGKDLEDARHVAKDLGIEFRVVDISKIVGAMERGLKAFRPNPVALGNLRARARMVVLYYVANAENRVVMGTGNKSEIAV